MVVKLQDITGGHDAKLPLPKPDDRGKTADSIEYDLGNMVAFDFSPTSHTTTETCTTRDNAQLLVNAIFSLPSTSAGEIGGRLAQLPAPVTRLPREKHCPKPRPETRWEKFAREKGILNKKRDRMLWDQDRQDWVPRWGYKSKVNDDLNNKDKNWVQELKTGQSWDTDELAEKKAAKRQRIADQKKKEDRNVYEALGTRETKTVPKDKAKLENKAKIHVAGVSDASMGKYSTTRDGKTGGVANNRNKRVKVLPFSGAEERSRDLKILDRIISPQPVLNAAKAARMAMHEAQQQIHAERKEAKSDGGGKRRSKQGGKKTAKPQRTLRKLRKAGSKK